MKVNELTVDANRHSRRLGRGIGSGRGKTAGRGTKGQNARTGGGVRPGFAGGQNPLAKILPKKRGFVALNHTDYQVIGLDDLAGFKAGAVVDAAALKAAGLINHPERPVKLLNNGKLELKLTVKVQSASSNAKAAVEQAGGKIEVVNLKSPAAKTQSPAKTSPKATPASKPTADTE